MRKQLAWLSTFVLTCLVCLASAMSLASIPHRINYQGRLVDSMTGEPLAGPHTMVFRIYDAEVGGDPALWTESQDVHADTVGVVSVTLGSVMSLDISFDGRLWLEVEVDGEVLSPRRELVSVPYAFHAMDSDSLGGLHSGSYSLVGHMHDDRYYTETELNASDGSDPNIGSNLVHWDNLSGVPAGFADGVDDTGGGAGDGHSLDADDGYPEDVVYVNADGKVGVGTNQAERLLHIYDGSAGTVTSVDAAELVVEDDGNARINLLTPNSKSSGIDFGDPQDANAGWVTYDHTTNKMKLGVNNTDKVTIESDGDVGIGTTSPQKKLHVAGDIRLNAGGDVEFAGSSTEIREASGDMFVTADDDLYLSPDDDIHIRKDGGSNWASFDNGNKRLGVGVTSPQKRLHVAGDIKLDPSGDAEGEIVFGNNGRIYPWLGSDLCVTAAADLVLEPAGDIHILKQGDAPWATFDNDDLRLGISGAALVGHGERLRVNGKVKIVGPGGSHLEISSTGAVAGQLVNFETADSAGPYQDVLQLKTASHSHDNCQFIECQRGGAVKFKVNGDGEVYADGSFHPGGADLAEMIAVSGGAFTAEQGDVMVIDPGAERSVARSAGVRSTLVAGVYSTEPGFIGSERGWDIPAKAGEEEGGTHTLETIASGFNEVPLAVVGIVPCKVSAENGPISPGDLLVTASTPGHAMRDDKPMVGTVLGKALGSLDSGTGTIKVLVTLQ